MTRPNGPPEIPYPFPPLREPPRRTDPVVVPLVDPPPDDPVERLFDRRTIMVSGVLKGESVTTLCARLMALDGRSADDVDVLLNSSGGPMTEIVAVLDVFDLMRAPVNVTCLGAAQGTAAVALACATGERRAGRNARISLRMDDHEPVSGTAADLRRQAEERLALLDRLTGEVATATGQPSERIARELDSGVVHDALAARSLGIIDRIVDRRGRGGAGEPAT